MFKFYRVYFVLALLLGFHKCVHRTSNRWASADLKRGRARHDAAHTATLMLVDDGYHACPFCTWATETLNEHLLLVGSYCHDEQLSYLRRKRREQGMLSREEVVQLAELGHARHGNTQTLH